MTVTIAPELACREHPAIGVVLLCQLLRDMGHDPSPLLAAEGLRLTAPTATVEAIRELGFIHRVLATVPVPDLGLLAGRRHHFSVFGMWGLAMISSATLRGAIRVGLRFIDLTHTYLDWQFVRETGAPRLTLDEPYPLGQARQFIIERDLAAAVTLVEDLLGHRAVLEAVRIPYEAPAHADRYREIFGCEIAFGADRTELMIKPDLLDARPVQANPAAASLAEAQCRDLAAHMKGRGSTANAVRGEILSVPGEFPDLTRIAARLNLSERGLRRRLAAEGSSYRNILREVRETLARAYLLDTRLQVEEIAERLGYSDASNFSHAFRQWTGTTPGVYRRDQLNARIQS
ncbi:MAG: AraC family transcriptional regulator [Gammaproteobacteria bacterium]|nr:MAG: AraC family transcriptional regulator [Gammaproteobacteria bacterium]